MDKLQILEKLRARSTDGPNGRTLERLQAVFQPLDSLAELERELPPAIRYLGPGSWLDTIREASKK